MDTPATAPKPWKQDRSIEIHADELRRDRNRQHHVVPDPRPRSNRRSAESDSRNRPTTDFVGGELSSVVDIKVEPFRGGALPTPAPQATFQVVEDAGVRKVSPWGGRPVMPAVRGVWAIGS